MVPIYEQIVDAVKTQIRKGELKEDENLPSVRMLAKDLKISALTVKKAYDALEEEGFAITIHGKGTYITAANTELLLEEQKKEIEADLEKAVLKARRCGISDEELKNFPLIVRWKFCRDRLQGLWGKTEQVKVQHFMQYWDCLDRIAGKLLY